MKTIADGIDEPCAEDASTILDDQSFGIYHDEISASSIDSTSHASHLFSFGNKQHKSMNQPESLPCNGNVKISSSQNFSTKLVSGSDAGTKNGLNPESRLQENQQCNERVSTQSESDVTEIGGSVDEEDGNTQQADVINLVVNPHRTEDCMPSSELPEYLQLLQMAIKENGDSKVPMSSKPDWLDLEKLKRGQRFAREYFFGLVFAEMLSLMLLFLHSGNLLPLIYTGKSDTPFKAFKRYLSTVLRVMSWYESDLWKENSEAHKNLRIVRDMHQTYRTRINDGDPQVRQEKCTLKPPVWNESNEKLREDFRAMCPYTESGIHIFSPGKDYIYINQAEMAGTQFGFVGLMIVYPHAFGAARASEEDLEGFVHLWRCIGYLLGIDDRYNFCAGSLDTIRQRSRDVIDFIMKPKLRDVDSNWEHMYRCVIEGISYYVPGVNFEVSVLYLLRLLGVHSPYLESSITCFQKFMYRVTYFVMHYLLQFGPFRALNNWLLKNSIKKMTAPSPSWIREHEQRVYPYQTQNCGALCTRP